MKKIIGLDVSKKDIGGYNTYTQKHFKINNNYDEIKKFLEDNNDFLIVYEATGVYSTTLQKACNDNNQEHLFIHPSDSSRLFKSLFSHNKTDALDAKSLASLAEMLINTTDLACKNKFIKAAGNDVAKMRSIMSEIHYYKDEIKRKKNHIEKLENDAFCDKEFIEKHKTAIILMHKEIALLETKVIDIFKEIGLYNKYECIQTIPGIGETVALEMTVYFSTIAEKGLKKEDQKKMLAYSGLNPLQVQSGTSISGSHLSKRGDKHIRRAMYMPGIQRQKTYKSDTNKDTGIGKFVGRMINHFSSPSRKRGKSIACAVGHKLLSIGRSMFHTELVYNYAL